MGYYIACLGSAKLTLLLQICSMPISDFKYNIY